MVRRLQPADPELRDRLAAEDLRELSWPEYQQLASSPITDREREDLLDLIAWFTRRYPTAAERLAYARRAYRRWTAEQERGHDPNR